MNDMFFGELVKFGDPWHGLYRFGRQELPNGSTRIPATVPSGGDVCEIRVPGQPAVSNELDDTAAGRTWLNYGILAGTNHVLYGKALGDMSWVYVAADNICYKATASVTSVDSVSVALVPLVGTAPTQTLTGVALDQAVAVNGSLLVIHKIMDVSPDGRQVVIAHHYINNPDYPHAMSLLTLAGSLPAVTASRTLIYDLYSGDPAISGWEVSDNRVTTWTIVETLHNDSTGDTTTRTFTTTPQDWASGANYPALPPGYRSTGYVVSDEGRSGVFTRKDVIGYVFKAGALLPVKFVNSTTDTNVGATYPYDSPELRTYHGTYTRTQHVEVAGQAGATVGQAFQFSGTLNVATQVSGNGECYYRRYSNRTYGLTEPINQGQPSAFTRHHPPVSPTAQATGSPVDGQPPFATYQPVTQTLTWHSQTLGDLCFL